MIATGLRLRDRHPVVYVLALALLGALLALLAVEALAAVSSLLGLTALHDVGVNTGPVAAIGGAAAGVGAGAGGGGPPTALNPRWDPVAKRWDYGPEPYGPPRSASPVSSTPLSRIDRAAQLIETAGDYASCLMWGCSDRDMDWILSGGHLSDGEGSPGNAGGKA